MTSRFFFLLQSDAFSFGKAYFLYLHSYQIWKRGHPDIPLHYILDIWLASPNPFKIVNMF